MSLDATPEIAFAGVVKEHGGAVPLRLAAFDVHQRDRVAMFGLDEAAAETVLHLISGAALPDEGSVRVAGRDTRSIVTDTDWLLSLDRFGVVTRRAVLLESLPAAANIALPITAAIDPMTPETRARVGSLAEEAGLSADRLAAPCNALSAYDRLGVHLARAIALEPRLLLLEHATADLRDADASRAFGQRLRAIAERRGIGWLAITSDAAFAHASGSEQRRLDIRTGIAARLRWWQRTRA